MTEFFKNRKINSLEARQGVLVLRTRIPKHSDSCREKKIVIKPILKYPIKNP
jgi:hypothetical protein